MIDLRQVLDRWRRLDVTVQDLPFGLLLLAASLVPVLRGYGTQLGGLPTRTPDAASAVVAALEALPLAGRRRWPGACLALVSLGFVTDQLCRYHLVAGAALPIALLSAGAHVRRRRATAVALISAGYVPLVLALRRSGAHEETLGFTTFYLAMAAWWTAGAWLRVSRAAEEERRRHVAETTRTAERTRIARELHDVVTHHVTAMVVQAEAARYLVSAPERLDAALSAVGETGRRAVSDLRHLLDLLDPAHGTGPGTPAAGELGALVEHTRQAGQPVEFTEEGSPAEPPGSAEAVAYRVVQEALTNALKHAHGSRTVVAVHHGARGITVEVSTAGSGRAAGSPGGSGRGLSGLRERVGVLGGEFSAGRRPGGAFVVRATIPAGGPS